MWLLACVTLTWPLAHVALMWLLACVALMWPPACMALMVASGVQAAQPLLCGGRGHPGPRGRIPPVPKMTGHF